MRWVRGVAYAWLVLCLAVTVWAIWDVNHEVHGELVDTDDTEWWLDDQP